MLWYQIEGWQSWHLKGAILNREMAADRQMLLSLVYQKDICETKFIKNRDMLLPYTALTTVNS